jgi:hypothetical protein
MDDQQEKTPPPAPAPAPTPVPERPVPPPIRMAKAFDSAKEDISKIEIGDNPFKK